jgi:hypothetical protein
VLGPVKVDPPRALAALGDSTGQSLRCGSYMAAKKKWDDQDQPNQSVHASRGTTSRASRRQVRPRLGFREWAARGLPRSCPSRRNLAGGVFALFAAGASVAQRVSAPVWLLVTFSAIAAVGAVIALILLVNERALCAVMRREEQQRRSACALQSAWTYPATARQGSCESRTSDFMWYGTSRPTPYPTTKTGCRQLRRPSDPFPGRHPSGCQPHSANRGRVVRCRHAGMRHRLPTKEQHEGCQRRSADHKGSHPPAAPPAVKRLADRGAAGRDRSDDKLCGRLINRDRAGCLGYATRAMCRA